MTRTIKKEITIAAPAHDVWQAWTTEAGALTFFAPKANVELKLGGRYEMLFDLDAPPGSQGGEGLKILSYLPEEMLSFEWNAPPHLPNVRGERTWVVIQLAAQSDSTTLLKLTHLGWGQGQEWDQAFAYFMQAWQIVLGRLAHRFAVGPIDWDNPYRPEIEP